MHEPVDLYLPADPEAPRMPAPDPPGIRIHRGPPLHPDDLDVVDGIPVTSVSRTLIDLADVLNEHELRECFRNARERGLLDPETLHAARSRVEWRASLPLADRLIAEFTRE